MADIQMITVTPQTSAGGDQGFSKSSEVGSGDVFDQALTQAKTSYKEKDSTAEKPQNHKAQQSQDKSKSQTKATDKKPKAVKDDAPKMPSAPKVKEAPRAEAAPVVDEVLPDELPEEMPIAIDNIEDIAPWQPLVEIQYPSHTENIEEALPQDTQEDESEIQLAALMAMGRQDVVIDDETDTETEPTYLGEMDEQGDQDEQSNTTAKTESIETNRQTQIAASDPFEDLAIKGQQDAKIAIDNTDGDIEISQELTEKIAQAQKDQRTKNTHETQETKTPAENISDSKDIAQDKAPETKPDIKPDRHDRTENKQRTHSKTQGDISLDEAAKALKVRMETDAEKTTAESAETTRPDTSKDAALRRLAEHQTAPIKIETALPQLDKAQVQAEAAIETEPTQETAEAKTEIKPDTANEIKPETKLETKPDVIAEVKTETKPEAKEAPEKTPRDSAHAERAERAAKASKAEKASKTEKTEKAETDEQIRQAASRKHPQTKETDETDQAAKAARAQSARPTRAAKHSHSPKGETAEADSTTDIDEILENIGSEKANAKKSPNSTIVGRTDKTQTAAPVMRTDIVQNRPAPEPAKDAPRVAPSSESIETMPDSGSPKGQTDSSGSGRQHTRSNETQQTAATSTTTSNSTVSFSAASGAASPAAPAPQTPATPVTTPKMPLPPQAPMSQVDGSVKWLIRNNEKAAEIQLYPEHLGKVTIRLRIEGNEVHARIWASEASTMPMLREHKTFLENSLKEQGLNLSSFDLQQGSAGAGKQAQSEGQNQHQGQNYHFASPMMETWNGSEFRQELPTQVTAQHADEGRVELYA